MDTQIETLRTDNCLGAGSHGSDESMRDTSKEERLQKHASRILGPWSHRQTPFHTARTHVGEIEEGITDIFEDTINLRSEYQSLVCCIGFPEEYDVADVDPDTILLNGKIGAACSQVMEEMQLLIVKFPWFQVEGILRLGEVEFTVSGKLSDGTPFECSDTVPVTDKGEAE